MRREPQTAMDIQQAKGLNRFSDLYESPAELRYHELAEFTADGYLVTDLQGIILEANQAAAQLLQTRMEFLIGKPLPLFVGERRRSAIYTLLLTLREGGTIRDWPVVFQPWSPRGVEAHWTSADGKAAWSGWLGRKWMLRNRR